MKLSWTCPICKTFHEVTLTLEAGSQVVVCACEAETTVTVDQDKKITIRTIAPSGSYQAAIEAYFTLNPGATCIPSEWLTFAKAVADALAE